MARNDGEGRMLPLKIRLWKSGEGGHRAEVSNPVLCERLKPWLDTELLLKVTRTETGTRECTLRYEVCKDQANC